MHLLLVVAVRSVSKTICLLYQTVECRSGLLGFCLHCIRVGSVGFLIFAVQFFQGRCDVFFSHRIPCGCFLEGFHGFLHVAVFRDGTGFDRGDQVIGLPFPPVPFVLCLHQGLLALFAVGFGLLFRDVSGVCVIGVRSPAYQCSEAYEYGGRDCDNLYQRSTIFPIFCISAFLWEWGIILVFNWEDIFLWEWRIVELLRGHAIRLLACIPLTVRFVVRLAPEVISRLECLRWVIIRARASGGWGRCLWFPLRRFGWVIPKVERIRRVRVLRVFFASVLFYWGTVFLLEGRTVILFFCFAVPLILHRNIGGENSFNDSLLLHINVFL